MPLDKAGEQIADGVGVPAGTSHAPADLIAVGFGHKSAAARLQGAAAVNIPFAFVEIVAEGLVADRQILNGHLTHVVGHEVPLRNVVRDINMPCLGHNGRSVVP